MIKQSNPLLYVNVESEVGFQLQLKASEKGFTWSNGNKIYNPYFPSYALVFDLFYKEMFYYPIKEALIQLPNGKRNLKEIKIILNKMEDRKNEQSGTFTMV